ncbi:MAG: alpha/beta hydrolase [Candidatus Melainabacteria bacterium]|nr:MAG: alpha/beta hydrolase [Candidatus Melainabacteria bacterium]
MKSAGFTGRQKYYGPHRKDSLTYEQIDTGESVSPSLKRLNSIKDISIESSSDVLIFVHGFNTKFETSMLTICLHAG